jgi:plastocyanin
MARRLTHTRPLALLAPLVLLVGVTAGCGGSDSSKAAATTSGSNGAATKTLTIKDFAFSPVMATAKKGDTITVVNKDGATHTVTADDGAFDTGKVKSGANAEIKLDKAGSLSFHCEIHSYMKGTIEVTE